MNCWNLRLLPITFEVQDFHTYYVGKKDFGYGKLDIANHRNQVSPYEFRNLIKWGKNHFYSSYFGGFETIFCDDLAKSIIKNAEFQDIEFMPVIHYKKGRYLDNVHQMIFSNVLPNESLILDKHFIKKECDMCGTIQYEYSGLSRLGVHKEFLKNGDR